MNKIEKLLMALILMAVRGIEPSDELIKELTPEDIHALYKLAKHHDMAHLVGAVLPKLKLSPAPETASKLSNAAFVAVYRAERIHYYYEQMCAVLDKASIPYIPLKGMIIRHLYPEAWMRPSCDIDVLVKKEDLEKAVACLTESLSLKPERMDSHDVPLVAENGFHIEVHYSLIEEHFAGNGDKLLQDVWKVAVFAEGYRMVMPNELFFYYHLAHMAKHFKVGGCGIRSYLDLVMMHEKLPFDSEKLALMLKEGGLDAFYRSAKNVCALWFENKEVAPMDMRVQRFVLSGGLYGTLENNVVIKQTGGQGKTAAIFARLFPAYNEMVYMFPSLKTKKWLLPFCYIIRFFKVIFRGRFGYAMRELGTYVSTEDSEKERMGEMLSHVGL